jgi:adenylate cyclase
MERRLSAIFAADMVGYSRLMEADEIGTLQRQKTHRSELINPTFEEYHGRIVKEMGDGILVEFPSVVEAVQCAVTIQQEMIDREADVSDDLHIQYRIGVNLGDIVIEGDDIFGDGVNIAARLEQMAESGGICISGTAYDHLKSKVEVGYEFLGEVQVKNIKQAVRAYRVLTDPDQVGVTVGEKRIRLAITHRFAAMAAVLMVAIIGSVAWWWLQQRNVEPIDPSKIAIVLPDKPSIAVLPFDNMSNDPQQDYFSDGITEDLITDLSQISGLFVIARNSVFTYKGRAVKIQTVGRELGVKYVLEGSIRKQGNRVRINAQLVDSQTGGHLWAERFDRDFDDIFALQDEVVEKIVLALQVRLTTNEKRGLLSPHTNSTKAYDIFLQGRKEFIRRSKDGNGIALALFEDAVNLDSQFARGYAYLAWAHTREFIDGWSDNSANSLKLARNLVDKAVAIDNRLPLPHFVNGLVALYEKDHEKALASMAKAIALDPNFSDAYAVTTRILNLAGRPETGLKPMETAMRLSPNRPQAYFFILGTAYFGLGRYEDAAKMFKKALERNPSAQRPRMWLAATYSMLDQIEDAEWEASEILSLNPNFSISQIGRVIPFKNPAHLEILINGLRKAGLPE